VTDTNADALSKVARVTLVFWVIKILATTLGETGGDALSMTLKLGYGISSLIFLGFFGVTLAAQIASKRYHPVFYWAVVVATCDQDPPRICRFGSRAFRVSTGVRGWQARG
jgi:uncharacterized membrane-anchored protein